MLRARAVTRRLAPPLALIAAWLILTNHGPFSSTVISDLPLYGAYAHDIASGLIPYRDIDLEYPPLALAPIGLLGGDVTAFSLAMLGCALVCQECAYRLTGEKAAWAMVALPAIAGAQVRTHFDLFATALVMLALVARQRGRGGGFALGFATAAKLWPALVAAATLREHREWLRFALVTVPLGLVTLGLGGWFMVKFHVERPIQIESTPSTLLSLLPVDVSTTGYPVVPDRFRSHGTDSPAAGVVAALFVVLELATIAWFVWKADRLRRGSGDTLGERVLPGSQPSNGSSQRIDVLVTLGVTLAFVALGKVLSPQFMLWLFPLAIAAWGWPAVLVAAATALTQVEFPTRYFDLVFRDQTMLGIVAARNALLIIALVATARALARSSPPAPVVSTGSAPR